MFTLRFDMRAPQPGAAPAELYTTALEMAAWAEQRGCVSVLVSEHHGASDGYLPSPLVLASALAARTTSTPIVVGAVLLNMYDPVKLAEDMVVLDLISGGRVAHVVGLGYRPEEYEMFGVDFSARGKVMDAKLATLLAAITGEPFEHDGRTLQVTPAPFTPGGPRIMYGGHSLAAARRAGRNGLDFFAEGAAEGLEEAYREAAAAAGHEPGTCLIPSAEQPTSLFVATDPDTAWDRIGPYLLHDAQMYAEWMGSSHDAASKSSALTVDDLRAEGGAYRIVTPDQAVDMVRSGMLLGLQPLCGGLAPDLAWESVRLVGDTVMPALGAGQS